MTASDDRARGLFMALLVCGMCPYGENAHADAASDIRARIQAIELERAAIQETRKAIGMLKDAGNSIRDQHCRAHWNGMRHHLAEKERLEKLGGWAGAYDKEADEQLELANRARQAYESCFAQRIGSNRTISKYEGDYGASISDYGTFISTYRLEKQRYEDYGGASRFRDLGIELNDLRARLGALEKPR